MNSWVKPITLKLNLTLNISQHFLAFIIDHGYIYMCIYKYISFYLFVYLFYLAWHACLFFILSMPLLYGSQSSHLLWFHFHLLHFPCIYSCLSWAFFLSVSFANFVFFLKKKYQLFIFFLENKISTLCLTR